MLRRQTALVGIALQKLVAVLGGSFRQTVLEGGMQTGEGYKTILAADQPAIGQPFGGATADLGSWSFSYLAVKMGKDTLPLKEENTL